MSQDQGILIKNALKEIKRLQTNLTAIKAEKNEPIAIIGMSCRFPGGSNNPHDFWDLLRDGQSASVEVPAERWNIDDYYDPEAKAPGTMNTRHGCFVDQVAGFDPAFFKIAPREAVSMDPQQRLLLELCWDCLLYTSPSPRD